MINNQGDLTVAEVGLSPRSEGRLAIALAALGEGERQGGRAADDLCAGTTRECLGK